jgi:trimethylamine:corrinoid methyltransferase-like protein
MQKIHAQSLFLLENTGFGIEHEIALKMLAEAGATVAYENNSVRIPAELVEKSLKTVPRKITLAGRNPGRDLILEPGVPCGPAIQAA